LAFFHNIKLILLSTFSILLHLTNLKTLSIQKIFDETYQKDIE